MGLGGRVPREISHISVTTAHSLTVSLVSDTDNDSCNDSELTYNLILVLVLVSHTICVSSLGDGDVLTTALGQPCLASPCLEYCKFSFLETHLAVTNRTFEFGFLLCLLHTHSFLLRLLCLSPTKPRPQIIHFLRARVNYVRELKRDHII